MATQNQINNPISTTPIGLYLAAWDTNKNLSANNHINASTSTVTSASTVTLTVASTQTQIFTGSTAQTLVMPVASTLQVGQTFRIVNQSTATVTIQTSSNASLYSLLSGYETRLECVLASGTTAASWANSLPTTPALIATSLTLNGGTALATYSNGTFTPTANSLTVVGTPTYTGTYVKIGALVIGSISVNSTTSTTSAQGITNFTGMPYAPAGISAVPVINASNGASIGLGALYSTSSGTLYPPTWTTLASVVISFCYTATTN